jgi:hypothetical protein
MEDVWTVVQIALMAAGVPLAVRGLRREWQAIMLPLRTPGKVLMFFRGFRMSIIGLALVGIGAGWMWDQTWLIVLSAAIGFEETIESSIDVFALTKGKDLRLGPAAPARRPTGR